MRLEEDMLCILDNIGYFLFTNIYYHMFLIVCSVYMMGYGIPLLIDEILKKDI